MQKKDLRKQLPKSSKILRQIYLVLLPNLVSSIARNLCESSLSFPPSSCHSFATASCLVVWTSAPPHFSVSFTLSPELST